MNKKLKQFLKQVLPPFVWLVGKFFFLRIKAILSEATSKQNNEYTKIEIPIGFHGDYSSFDEALSVCGHSADANYSNTDLLEKTLYRTNKLVLTESNVMNTKTMRLLSVFYRLISKDLKELTVLDFGGALGNHYFSIRKYLPRDLMIHWKVVELTKTAEIGNKHFANGELSFVDKIEEKIDCYPNILLSSSSLQYVPDPLQMALCFSKMHPDWIVFDRMPFLTHGSAKVVIQRVSPHVYDALYPCHILRIEDLLAVFPSSHWSKELHWVLDEEIISVNGEEIKYQGFALKKIN